MQSLAAGTGANRVNTQGGEPLGVLKCPQCLLPNAAGGLDAHKQHNTAAVVTSEDGILQEGGQPRGPVRHFRAAAGPSGEHVGQRRERGRGEPALAGTVRTRRLVSLGPIAACKVDEAQSANGLDCVRFRIAAGGHEDDGQVRGRMHAGEPIVESASPRRQSLWQRSRRRCRIVRKIAWDLGNAIVEDLHDPHTDVQVHTLLRQHSSSLLEQVGGAGGEDADVVRLPTATGTIGENASSMTVCDCSNLVLDCLEGFVVARVRAEQPIEGEG
mmetsp:Transcript_148204/g.476019  ORF Transcript_148204/g.476019 Transcript_148204/m.476019 type:complete len:271 (+) Transcript_148204:2487-3299(+)